jgi:hypothetical protein
MRRADLYPRIQQPCSKSWDSLAGDDRKRFCGDCQHHVHDLGAMSPAERSRLLKKSGRCCVAYDVNSRTHTADIGWWKFLDRFSVLLRPAHAAFAIALACFATGCATTPRKETSCAPPTTEEIQASREDDGKSYKTVGVIVVERPLWKRILWPW